MYLLLLLLIFIIETESLDVALNVLEFTIYIRLVSNSLRSPCLHLLSAQIKANYPWTSTQMP